MGLYEGRIREVQEIQAAHRRLLVAREAGEEPDPVDVAAAEKDMENPYWMHDRPWAPDPESR